MTPGRADSSGLPWQARELASTGFAGDDGGADPGLEAALARPRQDPADPGRDDADLVEAVRGARLLVPVLAHAGDVAEEGGLAVEKRTDMAAVTLLAPDGTRALPVFTSTAALATWDPAARPVPVTAARAAQAGLSEGCAVLVVDVGGARPRELRTSMVCALAEERPWRPPAEDPVVRDRVAAALAPEADVRAHELGEGRPRGRGVLAVAIVLAQDASSETARAVLARVGERLAADPLVRTRVDGLTFALG